ncbi:YdeI/OmpD-associated family protein [Duncaniella freteri]|nr:YdeI/OmpD-associated family protein [Duncaniella freteri]
MTDKGRSACPDLDAEFVIDADIIAEFEANPAAWSNFRSFPALYQRVRIDNIQANKSNNALFTSRLTKLINASESGVMIGDWHDCGRLLDY